MKRYVYEVRRPFGAGIVPSGKLKVGDLVKIVKHYRYTPDGEVGLWSRDPSMGDTLGKKGEVILLDKEK